MTLKNQTFEMLYKPYSVDIRGYILRITDLIYIVINSRLSKNEAAEAEHKLSKLSAIYPNDKLVILQADGEVQKANNLDFLERAC